MSPVERMWWVVLLGLGVYFIVRHHADYLFRRRPMTFGAFLGTAGWIIVTLVALAGLGGGLHTTGPRRVELAAVSVGIVLIAVGRRFE